MRCSNVRTSRSTGRCSRTTLCVTSGTGVLFGLFLCLAPAASGQCAAHALWWSAGGGRGASWRVRGGLVAAELAIGVMLLAGAGLLIGSFGTAEHVDPRVRDRPAWTSACRLPNAAPYAKPGERAPILRRARGASRRDSPASPASRPGTSCHSTNTIIPSASDQIDGVGGSRTAKRPSSADPRRHAGFPEGAQRALRRGATSRQRTSDSAPVVAIVNEAAARLPLPRRDAMGHHLELGTGFGLGGPRAGGEVIGVVRDVHDDAIAKPASPPSMRRMRSSR